LSIAVIEGRVANGGTEDARFVGAPLAIKDETQETSFFSSRFGMLARQPDMGEG